MVSNDVIIDIEDDNFWFCQIIKEESEYSVLMIADLNNNLIYTLGGENYSVCKNKKQCQNNGELYEIFMRKIGKMCKKPADAYGHYFSPIDVYEESVPAEILNIAENFIQCNNAKSETEVNNKTTRQIIKQILTDTIGLIGGLAGLAFLGALQLLFIFGIEKLTGSIVCAWVIYLILLCFIISTIKAIYEKKK